MRFEVLLQEEAEEDLAAIYDYVSGQVAQATAHRFIERINTACASLESFPARGVPRDDLVPGLRLLFSVRRVIIAYQIRNDKVVILRILRAGRDYLSEDFSEA